MPYKDPIVAKEKAKERMKRWQDRQRIKRVQSGLPADGRGRHKNHATKDNHPRWNNGISISSHGYIKIQVGNNHPLSDPNGYAYLHYLIWVAAGNEYLQPGEVLHHKNGYSQDNKLENLDLMLQSEHIKRHIYKGKAIKP